MNRVAAYLLATMVLAVTIGGVRLLQPQLLPEPRLPVLDSLGGDFRLASTRGGDLALAQLRGRLVLLNFGFTSCPDICPTVLVRMRSVLDALGDDALALQPLFVTIDPERDSLAVLKPWVEYFHPALVGLRGTPAETRHVAALYKVHYERAAASSAPGYGFMHSEQIYLIDRRGRVRATFGSGVTDAAMLAAIRGLIHEPG